MRNFKTIILGLGLAFMLSGCWDNRPMNNDGQGSLRVTQQGSNPLYDPDYYYELDTWGTNADVFEFTPKGNPNYICISVGTERLDCIPKGK